MCDASFLASIVLCLDFQPSKPEIQTIGPEKSSEDITKLFNYEAEVRGPIS